MNFRQKIQALRRRYQLADLVGPALWERKAEFVTVFLGVALVGLLTLGSLLSAVFGSVTAVAPSSSLLEVSALQESADLKGEQSQELLGRPLFWQSRRPPEPPSPEVAPKVVPQKFEPLKGVSLIGVFGPKDALGLIAKVDGKLMRISPGETVKGWSMVGYADNRARFKQGKRETTLQLPLTTPNASSAFSSTGGASKDGKEDEAAFSDEIGFGGSRVTK